MSKQGQKAGDNSQQLQAGRDIVVAGVSAADVVEITRAEVSRVLDELTRTARDVADSRVNALAQRITEHFADKPQLFAAFGEPDFQYLLQDAGRAAASSDEEHTEQLLVDLLTRRAEEGNGRRVRLATSQAIKAADNLSKEALDGLTALWAMTSLMGDQDAVHSQVIQANNVAQALVKLGLPQDKSWLSDADALNLVRLQHGGIVNRRSYREIIQHRVNRHLIRGINIEDSREALAAVQASHPLLKGILAPHQLKDGFVVLPGENREDFLSLLPSNLEPTAELEQLIEQNGYGTRDQEALDELDKLIASREAMVKVGEWWDATPLAEFTVVGDVVGFVNARRYVAFSGATTVGELLNLRSGG